MSDEVSTNDHDKRTILTERRGSTLIVTINRPEVKNALDEPTASALALTFREFDHNEALAVAVLNGVEGPFVLASISKRCSVCSTHRKGKEDFCGSDSSITPCKNCSERGEQSMSEAVASWKDTSGCDQTRSLRHRCETFQRSFVAH
jgi:1,4-dihydroxy-2-naphthoyl-CoA synthase